MPPRNPELPEGTDHIVNGAMGTSSGNSTGGAGSAGGLGGSTGGSTGTGFVGTGAGSDTGGMSGGIGGAAAGGTGGIGGSGGSSGLGGSGGGSYGGSSGSSSGDIKAQLREGVSSVQQQAGEKVRAYAETGKTRATGALQDLSQVVNEAADSIDERLGSEYGEYARRAADAVSGLADTLRERDVDQLFDDGRNLVRKSPGVALGAAAVVGFTLVRLIKSGMDDRDRRYGSRQDRDVNFKADPLLGASGTTTTAGTTTGGTTAGMATGTVTPATTGTKPTTGV